MINNTGLTGKIKMYTDKIGYKYFNYGEYPFWAYFQMNQDKGMTIEIEINLKDMEKIEYEKENKWYKFYPFIQNIG